MVNLLGSDEYFLWTDSIEYGRKLMDNNMGFRPVKIISQSDGWVILYGSLTSWDGANFYVEKLSDTGVTVWKKQLMEDDFKCNGLSVTYDDKNAYIFYTCDEEYDDDWNVIPGEGGMRLLVTDITGSSTGINNLHTTTMEQGCQMVQCQRTASRRLHKGTYYRTQGRRNHTGCPTDNREHPYEAVKERGKF